MNMASLKKELLAGDRRSLAQAITLLESRRLEDQDRASELLKSLPAPANTTLRVGVSGVPGVGKSSLIEQLGLTLIEQGHRVAVLAIDPSSEISRGSILGDKTRMEELSRRDESFIRPTPSRGHLGGVAVATKETIRLCESAGYDVVLVETVGVGQSEAQVSDLVDFFLFVALPGAGDELQGIKKGILEKVNWVAVNKCDGANKVPAKLAQQQLQASLKILRSDSIPVTLTSAVNQTGVMELIDHFEELLENPKEYLSLRPMKESRWLELYLEHLLDLRLMGPLKVSYSFLEKQTLVQQGKASVREVAEELFSSLKL